MTAPIFGLAQGAGEGPGRQHDRLIIAGKISASRGAQVGILKDPFDPGETVLYLLFEIIRMGEEIIRRM